MALAEGVENALAAALMTGGGHTVATLGAGTLAKWRPPGWCERAVVFADGDAAGHGAAAELERRMDAAGFPLEVRWLSRGRRERLVEGEGALAWLIVEGRGSLVLVPSARGRWTLACRGV